MGCAESRKHACSDQERALQNSEQSLGFAKHSCFIVAFILRKYSYRGVINQSQWEEIANMLELSTAKSSAGFDAFFKSFQADKLYSAKTLTLAGILLSAGLPRQKAALIAELYDEAMEGKLQEDTLLQIAADLVELVVKRLPLLLGAPVAAQVESYCERLKAPATVKVIVRELLGSKNLDNMEAVPVHEFIAGSEQSELYTPAGVRSIVRRLTADVQV